MGGIKGGMLISGEIVGICMSFECSGDSTGSAGLESIVGGSCWTVKDIGIEDEPKGTAETGKSTSSSSSEIASRWLGSSLWACFSALTWSFRVSKFSASMTAK